MDHVTDCNWVGIVVIVVVVGGQSFLPTLSPRIVRKTLLKMKNDDNLAFVARHRRFVDGSRSRFEGTSQKSSIQFCLSLRSGLFHFFSFDGGYRDKFRFEYSAFRLFLTTHLIELCS